MSACVLALGALTGIILARSLGPQARGELVAASIGPQVVAVLMTLGIDEALVYLLARSSTTSSGVTYGSALLTGLGAGVLASAIAELLQWWYFAPAATGVAALTLYAFGTFPVVNIMTQVMLGALRGRRHFATWNAIRVALPALYMSMVLGLALTHRLRVSSAVFALYLANVAVALALAARLRREASLGAHLTQVRALLRLGIQNHLIDVAQLVNQRLDQVLLTRLVSSTDLGYYAIAATYASIPLTVALAPALHLYSDASSRGRVDARRFRSLQLRTLVIMTAVAACAAIVAPVFLMTVFGRSFAGAGLPAIVLVFGAPPLAMSALRAAVWKGSGKPLRAAVAEGCGVVLTVVGLVVFAPRFGIMAAAVVSVAAYSLVSVILYGMRQAPVVDTGVDAAAALAESQHILEDAVDTVL